MPLVKHPTLTAQNRKLEAHLAKVRLVRGPVVPFDGVRLKKTSTSQSWNVTWSQQHRSKMGATSKAGMSFRINKMGATSMARKMSFFAEMLPGTGPKSRCRHPACRLSTGAGRRGQAIRFIRPWPRRRGSATDSKRDSAFVPWFRLFCLERALTGRRALGNLVLRPGGGLGYACGCRGKP